MTDNDTTTSQGKSPPYIAYHVRHRESGKGYWTRIGSAWPHADGKGFNLRIDIMPLDGRITLRLLSESED